ncbi:MAG TPA: DUF3237 domain-containing protein [Polyangiaceae bacterium]
MISSYDGLTLWYGTPDAPAPGREVPNGQPVSIVVGVRPFNPANTVDVRYRLDGGPVKTLHASPLRVDERKDAQYFRANFPALGGAKHVDYCPVAHCGGRQVPRQSLVPTSFSSFALPSPAEPPPEKPAASPGLAPRFTPGLGLVAQITVRLKPPTVIGETPHGFRIDYYAASGVVVGNAFHAEVKEDSVDYMLVRPDGVGVLDIHATLVTDDGAVITATYGGLIEFGEDGYRRMVLGNWPELPCHQVAPRLLTQDSRYRWMNRTQFLGVGQVDMRALIIKYDVYAVSTVVNPGAWAEK